MEELDRRVLAYLNGRWCGYCRYGVVEDPPCCYHASDLLAAVGVPADQEAQK